MSKSAFGVVSHEVLMEQAVPVAVTLVLANGTKAVVDLARQTVTWLEGPVLPEKKMGWLRQIAVYLAQQFVLELEQKKRENRLDGRQEISFEPRPDPNIIWWG